MKSKLFMILGIAFLASYEGGESSGNSNDSASNREAQVKEASPQDLGELENSKALNDKASDATAKVNSILNKL